MWPVPPALGTTTVAGSVDSIHSVSSDSFFKDGRKIRVGDCALFKPLQDTSPPFIGIIRWLTLDKENYLKLGVNWLYRPADVKLTKGITLEAAPNEIFYSFHKDEIPAASLLHPCKVAFLRKGVELPLGISSFVCRRVYDTSNRRLYWLTDRDYINERQEEVDQLLDKTRLEMHAAVQSGGRSPKPLNGPTSAPQLKPTTDGAQNSTNTFPSQVKGRKRERSDQSSDSVKRERSMKIEDGHSGQFRSDLKSEISKIRDKGGLVDLDGVEKFVQLIKPDRGEKKIDLACRTMLADVISQTENYECLGKFVHLKGLSVLDEWLQEIHKGKIGDGIAGKESDKSVEDFLFALLRALDKLPVDLHALQTCNVGKSVNHLCRSHKNLEIQKKAKGLVGTWKERVEAEMNRNETKAGPNQSASWPNKPGFPDVSQGGSRRAGGSSDASVKNSVTQPSVPKATPAKPGHGDSSSKLTSLSPGSVKSSPSLSTPIAIPRDSPSKVTFSNSASDAPMSTIKEERSSSSSQSQNNSQSCSSEHAKPAGSLFKEDARSSTAGSLNTSKTSSSAARTRKSSNGNVGSAVSGVSKESTVVKGGPVEKKITSEKVSQAGLACDRQAEVPLVDNGNNHRLIVRLPNLGRSPARSANGTHDDPSSIVSRSSSPRFPEKQELFDRKVKGKSDSCRSNIAGAVNKESRHRNDLKDGPAGSDDGDESPASFLDEELDRNGDVLGKATDSSKVTCSSSGIHKGNYPSDSNPGTSHDASFRSINVLIESCVKYSEAIPSMPAGDDRGMNLLASVAAGEMSKSEQVSPIGSPGRNLSVRDDSYTGNEAKRLRSDDIAAQSQGSADGDSGKQVSELSPVQVKGEEQHVAADASSSRVSEDSKTTSIAEEKPSGEHSAQTHVSVVAMEQTVHPCLVSDGRVSEVTTSSVGMLSVEKKDSQDSHRVDSRIDVPSRSSDGVEDLRPKEESPSDKILDCADKKISQSSITVPASDLVRSSVDNACNAAHLASAVKVEKEVVGELVSGDMLPENKLLSTSNPKAEGIAGGAELSSASESILDPNNVDKKTNCAEERTEVNQNEIQRKGSASMLPGDPDNHTTGDADSNLSDYNTVVQNSLEREDVNGGASAKEDLHENPVDKVGCMKSSGTETDKSEECMPTAADAPSSVTARSDMGGKLDFDLNEGFPVDDGCQGETATSVVPGYTSVANLHSPLSFLPMMSNGHPLVPVAAAARGPFVPPENFLKTTGEIGWRGSAATSAFRPAEPRKVLDMPLTTTDVHTEPVANKQGRPALDIDLNEPDDRFQDDISLQSGAPLTTSVSGVPYVRDYRRTEGTGTSAASSRSVGGLDLDLNRADEDTEMGQLSTSNSRRFDVLSVKHPSSGGFSHPEVNVLRNFDLNNGPGFDETGTDQPPPRQHTKNSVPFLPSVTGIRMNNPEFGSLSSWFPPGNSYPAVAIPSILPDRGEQTYPVVSTAGAQRILGPPTGGISFGPDGYRGPVLSSSAVAFPPGTSFPYPGFPFGTNFPLQSTSFSSGSTMYLDSSSAGGLCFPAVPSQLVGSASAVPSHSHYPRPYVISLPDGNSNGGGENNRRWVRQGLDLNAGPGVTDIDGRDDRLSSATRQLSVASSQTLAEEQMRMYQAAGAVLKRKEPEGGWDADRYSYKQPWQ